VVAQAGLGEQVVDLGLDRRRIDDEALKETQRTRSSRGSTAPDHPREMRNESPIDTESVLLRLLELPRELHQRGHDGD